MVRTSLIRLRWRLRGAWMWPSFIVLALVDGVIVHWLPLAGDSESALAGWLLGLIWMLIGIVLLVPPLGWLIRQVRGDMPRVVARDYAGTGVCLAITAIMLGVGIAHHPVVGADRAAMQDATARAEAYIGEHAPASFMHNLHHLETSVIQAPLSYYVCATSQPPGAHYCVVVDRSKPFGRSVHYSGSDPNNVLFQGTG
ncbi:MAG TPA: hypothetical protein VME01_04350 [Solirubrobacteraceae bacterium]|nr:hypothetical protein [Solirubrobacteraceae bacterium]